MAKTVGKAAVRCDAIDLAKLAAMEKHGKRLDGSSQRRRIRDDSPLVYGSLDLRARYDEHMHGVKQNAAAKKPVLHFIIRFPPELLEGPKLGHFEGSKLERQKMMLRQAIRFVQDTHGGRAVFAARVDRDEEGETIVDVFASPVYEKRTKRTPANKQGPLWASATRFGKELAKKHQEEIQRRHPDAKGEILTSPRMVGIALQSELAEWFRAKNGHALTPKTPKGSAKKDRIEKEAHERMQAEKREIEAEREKLDQEKAQMRAESAAERAEIAKERQELQRERRALKMAWEAIREPVRLLDGLLEALASRLGIKTANTVAQTLKKIKDDLDYAPEGTEQKFDQI